MGFIKAMVAGDDVGAGAGLLKAGGGHIWFWNVGSS